MLIKYSSITLTNNQVLVESTNCTIYKHSDSTKIIKRFTNKNAFLHELSIFQYIEQYLKNPKYVLIPTVDIDTTSFEMPKMQPLNLIPFQSLSFRDKNSLLLNIAKGIKELHDIGIIHNDLKLENILYDVKTLGVKLIDFGSAISPSTSKPITVTTPIYNSPEIIKTSKSDIWSFGIIIKKLCKSIKHNQHIKIVSKTQQFNEKKRPSIDMIISMLKYICLKIN